MANTKKITINSSVEDIRKKVTMHLAVIGKRAKDVQGKSLFSDITVSTAEHPLFNDLIHSAAESIVNDLSPFCGMYDTADNITFVITSYRWTAPVSADSPADNDKDLTKALKEAVENYLFNFTLAQYLSIIHPSTGEKYPPIYGSTYNNQCIIIINNIIGLCNLKREPKKSAKTYADVNSIADMVMLTIRPVGMTLPPSYITSEIYINGVLCPDGSAEVPAGEKVQYTVIPFGSAYSTLVSSCVITEDTTLEVMLTQQAPDNRPTM